MGDARYQKLRRFELFIPTEAFVGIQKQMDEAKKYGLVSMSPQYGTREYIMERLGEGIKAFDKAITRAKAPSIIVP